MMRTRSSISARSQAKLNWSHPRNPRIPGIFYAFSDMLVSKGININRLIASDAFLIMETGFCWNPVIMETWSGLNS